MIAGAVLVTSAAFGAFWKTQEAYGRAYERRTERLRETRESFYAAAHALLANPALDQRHLRFVKALSEHVVAGDRAGLHLRALRRASRQAKQKRPSNLQNTPAALRSDMGKLTSTAVEAIAERQPFWKPFLLKTYRRATEQKKRSLEQALSAIEDALDDCLMTAA